MIATCEPYVREWEQELAQVLRLDIKRVMANPVDISSSRSSSTTSPVRSRAPRSRTRELSEIANFEQLVELGRTSKLDANDRHIVQVVDWLLQYAFEQRATDIHLEPRRDVGNVRFRIDGVLHKVYQLPTPVMSAMTAASRCSAAWTWSRSAARRTAASRPRTPDGDEVELRLSTLPTAFGEKMVMRIFDPGCAGQDFTELGFSRTTSAALEADGHAPARHHPGHRPHRLGQDHHALLDAQAAGHAEVNVCTIEDPIEMVEPAFNQTQVQPVIGLDFAERRAHADAPGSRHHHGRRDPRPGDRRDGGAGRAHRPPRALHAAHQRRGLGDHAPARPRRAALPVAVDRARRARAAPGAHAVPATAGSPARSKKRPGSC